MSLVAEAAAVTTSHAKHLLDVGCGAGNYTLKLLERLPNLNVTLVDLSQVMLDRAVARIPPKTNGAVEAIQSDIRETDLGKVDSKFSPSIGGDTASISRQLAATLIGMRCLRESSEKTRRGQSRFNWTYSEQSVSARSKFFTRIRVTPRLEP
jgi:SAM-dependent methyltransferase